MTAPIRVMLCDDSAVMRHLIRAALSTDGSLEIVAEAGNGQEALDLLGDVRADVVIMDVEMPVMDGIDCVREIRRRSRRLPIIMFSALTARGAEATLDALQAGANDFATKPANVGHINEAMEHVRNCLVGKIRQWVAPGAPSASEAARPAPDRESQLARSEEGNSAVGTTSVGTEEGTIRTSSGVDAVAIGVSTGGPQALARLIGHLPLRMPIPILIVQHMPPVFTTLLAQRLSAEHGHQVCEARDGEELCPGRIFVAPGDHHLLAAREGEVVRAHLSKDPPENYCRPAVDPLFRSMAQCYGDRCLGVILTGMGKDGAGGAKALRDKGALVYAQDRSSSVVWGMAGNVVELGLANRVLPIDQIASELVRVTQTAHAAVV